MVRLSTWADVSEPRNSTSGLVLARLRFKPGVGGRADGLVFNGPTVKAGDVADGRYLVVNSCFDAQTVQGYQKVRSCLEHTAACIVDSEEGNAAACSFGEQLPPEDQSSTVGDPAASEEGFASLPAPPTDIPDGLASGL